MAKKPESDDELFMEHDDFGGAESPAASKSGPSGAAGAGKVGQAAAKAGPAGGLGGLLARLPVAGLAGKLEGLGGQVRRKLKGSGQAGGSGGLPVILLALGVLALTVTLIFMVVMLVGSLSRAAESSGRAVSSAAREAERAGRPEALAQGRAAEAQAGLSPNERAPAVAAPAGNARMAELARDPLFDAAILPDEPSLMRNGEIGYDRSPRQFWDLSDIRPGWQDLGRLYRTMLRERNTRDFHRLLGSEGPRPDQY
jgi:hypothetical protein